MITPAASDWRPIADLPRVDPYNVGHETEPPATFQPDAHDVLVQQYAEIGSKYKTLWAKYGAGCMLDNKRKAFLAAIAAKIRTIAAEKGTKVTESFIEEQAHAHADYSAWIEEQELGRLEFQQCELDLDMVREKIRRLDAVTRRGL